MINSLALITAALLISYTQSAGHNKILSENIKLVVTGSNTIAPKETVLAQRFEEKNPGTRVDVKTGGSSHSISDIPQEVIKYWDGALKNQGL